MAEDLHSGMFDIIGDMNHDGKVDMQDYHLWHDACEDAEIDGDTDAAYNRTCAGSGGSIVKALVGILVLLQPLQWIVKLLG